MPARLARRKSSLSWLALPLVLQVLEEQNGNRDIAHRLEAEHDHRPRNRADTAAASRPKIGGIDQAKHLVGQREILEDGVGELVDALGFAIGNLVDGADRSDKAGKSLLWRMRRNRKSSVACLPFRTSRFCSSSGSRDNYPSPRQTEPQFGNATEGSRATALYKNVVKRSSTAALPATGYPHWQCGAWT
jgi:hypothetical protein